jgi:hypothetical protein
MRYIFILITLCSVAAGQESHGLRVQGRVLDATTGEPIETFHIIQRPSNRGSSWQPHTRKEFKHGEYVINIAGAWDTTIFRADAPGYTSAISREVKRGEGGVAIDFLLKPAEWIRGKVVTPDKAPAAGAMLALANPGSEVRVEPPKLKLSGLGRDIAPSIARAGDDGAFKVQRDPEGGTIVIAHESGYLEISPEAVKPDLALVLQKWAKLEVRVMLLDKPTANEQMHISSSRPRGVDYPFISCSMSNLITDAQGRLTVERIAPGEAVLQFSQAFGFAAEFELTPGQKAVMTLGGKGRTVNGKLVPPAEWAGKIDLTKAKVEMGVSAPHIGFPGDQEIWKEYGAFMKKFGPAYTYAPAKVAADGSFSFEHVTHGDYGLNVSPLGAEGGVKLFGSRNVFVKLVPDDEVDSGVDLGEIKLFVPQQSQVK